MGVVCRVLVGVVWRTSMGMFLEVISRCGLDGISECCSGASVGVVWRVLVGVIWRTSMGMFLEVISRCGLEGISWCSFEESGGGLSLSVCGCSLERVSGWVQRASVGVVWRA